MSRIILTKNTYLDQHLCC